MRVLLLPLMVLALGASACATDPAGARPYTPPPYGPAASLLLKSDLPVKNARMNLAIYDDASTDCPSRFGYLGYIRRQGSDFDAPVSIPAGRRIRLAPGFSAGDRMCMGLPSYSLLPEPGSTYRIRHLVKARAEACQFNMGEGSRSNECASLGPEQQKEYCEFEIEQLVGSSWLPASDIDRMDFDSQCVPSPITADMTR